MGSVREPISRQQWGVLLFGLFVGVPIILKWYAEIEPFAAVWGVPYPGQLAAAAAVGGIAALFAYGERGRRLQALIFGMAGAPLYALLIEWYIESRTSVFQIELVLVTIGFFVPAIYFWKLVERMRGRGRPEGESA